MCPPTPACGRHRGEPERALLTRVARCRRTRVVGDTRFPPLGALCDLRARSHSALREIRLPHFAPRDHAHVASRHATRHGPVQRAFTEDCGFDGSPRSANTKRARAHDQDVVRIPTWISVAIVRIVSNPYDDVGKRRSGLCNHPVERRVPEQAPQRAIGCSRVKEIALDLPLGRQTREIENSAVRESRSERPIVEIAGR